MRATLVAAALIAAVFPQPSQGQNQKRESPAEVRRIVAQAICLSEAYPDSQIARDSAGIISVYQGTLGATVAVRDLEAVRALARDAKPAAPTPVGDRNFAIARCVLFADRADVVKLLGEPRGNKK